MVVYEDKTNGEFVCVCPYLLHSEGPDDVLRQQLCLYQCHLHVSVDLSIIWPVLTALHLQGAEQSTGV